MTTTAIAATTAATVAAASTAQRSDVVDRTTPGPSELAPEPSPERAAWLAGLAYVALFVLAIFANFAVRERLVDLDDAAATAANIAGSETTFRLAMLAFLVVFVLDVAVAWLLHLVFRPFGERRSLLAAWFRIAYTVFLGVAIVFMFVAVRLVDGGAMTSAIDADERAAQATLALDAFNATWMIGLVLFALHLIVLGRIMWSMAPKWVAAAPVVAGIVYLIDSIGYTVLTDYAEYQSVFSAIVIGPAIVTEGTLTVWLLHRGRRARSARRFAGDVRTVEPTTTPVAS